MKKRIISLILVVAMALLTLTGCAYNYAKDDMSKYATFNSQEFLAALQQLVIADGDFGVDEDGRNLKVEETIAAALLKLAGTDDKLFEGKPEKYDALYYCYVAFVGEPKADYSNMIYASKMDESKAESLQLGLKDLDGLKKLISDYILRAPAEGDEGFLDIKDYIYTTSAANRVGIGDVVTVSYTKPDDSKVHIQYVDLSKVEADLAKAEGDRIYKESKQFYDALVGMYVGVEQAELKLTVGEGESATEQVYKNVKVESILKDNSDILVADGDFVFVSYTKTFKWDSEVDPAIYGKRGSDGNYTVNATNSLVRATADAEGAPKTFLGELVGNKVGASDEFTVTETILDENGNPHELEVTYKSVKANWTLNGENMGEGIVLTDTPYDAIADDDKTTKETKEKNVYGEELVLNGKEITYVVYPVYYIDVEDITAETVVREYYSALNSTEVEEHDHTEEEHEHHSVYVFDTLNNESIKNGDKTIAALVGELVKLYEEHTKVKETHDTARKSLDTANTKLADSKSTSESELSTLRNNVTNANTSYVTAKGSLDASQKKIDDKIAEILAATDGSVNLEEALVADYKEYQYDTLETTYKATIKQNLAKEILKLAKKYITYGDALPKRAVKDAYDSVMNTYKYDFYEGKYTPAGSSSSSSSTSVTNYVYYNGDFNTYLLAKTGKSTMDEAKQTVQVEAEQTVRDIMLIYVLADCFGDEVKLTKDEKKELEKNLENTALLYGQYGLSFAYRLDDYIHAEQFDKIFNHLLEEDENDENLISYKRIKYDFEDEDDAE